MTGPAVMQGPGNPAHILTGDEWEAAQSAPHRLGQDPTKPMGAGRILTGDEWEQAQSAGDFGKLTFPAMPKIASDATSRLNPNAGPPDATVGGFVRNVSSGLDLAANANAFGPGGNLVAHGLAIAGRQVVAPAAEHPFVTGAMMNPVGALVGFGMAAHTVAKYGWQTAKEQFMSPEDRAKAEADPDRVSGEAALVQAVFLGLGSLAGIHGVLDHASDVGGGMTETGAASLHPLTEPNATVAHSPEGAAARDAELAKTAATAPLATPVVPEHGEGVERDASHVPAVGRAQEEGAVVPAGGRGRATNAATEEQRLGKAVSEPYSTGEPTEAFRRSGPPGQVMTYFSSPKGAEVLGTAAAAHGLPETASPFPPATALDEAWQAGHASIEHSPTGPTLNVATRRGVSELPQVGRAGEEAPVVPAEGRGRSINPATEEQRLGQAASEPYSTGEPTRARLASEGGGRRSAAPAATPATAAPGEPTPSGQLASVEGEGSTKTRGLAAGVEEKAVASKLTTGLGELPEYRSVNMEDQAAKATDLLAKDPELARRVATGEASAPQGLLPESVFTAVENKALAEGDVATIRDLASGKLTEQATTMGQRLRALGERDPESPVAAIQRIADSRAGESPEKPVADAIAELQKHLESGSKIDESTWTKFINSLRC